MKPNQKSKSVYFIVTDTEIYRTDLILEQIDEWIRIFKTGKIIRTTHADEESLDEFEAHLEQTLKEVQTLTQNDIDFFKSSEGG